MYRKHTYCHLFPTVHDGIFRHGRKTAIASQQKTVSLHTHSRTKILRILLRLQKDGERSISNTQQMLHGSKHGNGNKNLKIITLNFRQVVMHTVFPDKLQLMAMNAQQCHAPDRISFL